MDNQIMPQDLTSPLSKWFDYTKLADAVNKIEDCLKAAKDGEDFYKMKIPGEYSNAIARKIVAMYSAIGWEPSNGCEIKAVYVNGGPKHSEQYLHIIFSRFGIS